MRRFSWLCAGALLALATQLSAAPKDVARPYKGAFDFTVVGVQPVSGTEILIYANLAGEETYLGPFEGVAEYLLNVVTGQFSGSFVKTADNGDKLYGTLEGQFTAADLSRSVGTFDLAGGAGRFLQATGAGAFSNVTGHITFDGAITFDASDRRQ